jgi:hypothetical protein
MLWRTEPFVAPAEKGKTQKCTDKMGAFIGPGREEFDTCARLEGPSQRNKHFLNQTATF